MRKEQGFTLIELMMVIAIIAVIVGIAWPNYLAYLGNGKRAEAQANLAELSHFMERYYTQNSTYAGAILPFNQSPLNGLADYVIAANIPAGGLSYTLTATATGTMLDDKCGDLSLNQLGIRGVSKATVAECWRR